MKLEDVPLNLKDNTDIRLYIASNLRIITSSRHLINLLKKYLDEKDEAQRQLLAEEIILGIQDKEKNNEPV